MKQGVSFLESSGEGNKPGFNMRTIPERDAPIPTGQQFRVGQMMNKPMVPNPNFQSSSVNLNSILNVDRSRPLTRDVPENSSSVMGKRDSDVTGASKNVVLSLVQKISWQYILLLICWPIN